MKNEIDQIEEDGRSNEEEDVSLLVDDVSPQVKNQDPCSCFCTPFNFPRIGQSYVLRNRRQSPFLILVGPHWIGVLVTNGLIIFSTIAFLSNQSAKMSTSSIAVTLILAPCSLVFLFMTACTDPGILTTSDTNAGRPERRRFCDICDLHQPDGTEHCDDCQCCIEDHDHHCPWMGKCIGKKNMKWFKLFNLTWVIYLVFVLIITIQNVASELPASMFRHRYYSKNVTNTHYVYLNSTNNN